MVNQMDLLASVFNLFKQTIPASYSENILPLLMGKSNTRHLVMAEHDVNNLPIVQNGWKSIEPYGKFSAQLYNLTKMRLSKNNLAEAMPEKIKELTELLNTIKLKK